MSGTPLNDMERFVRRRPWVTALGVLIAGLMVWLVYAAFAAAIDANHREREESDLRAELARQTLVIERDLTALRIRAEETADCPVLYLQSLLAESVKPLDERNLGGVVVPIHCKAQDLAKLEDHLRTLEAEIAIAERHPTIERRTLRDILDSLREP